MSIDTPAAPTTTSIEEEQASDSFTELVKRLSHQSVVKHFDAYADIAWDDPDFHIDVTDPRWELALDEPLASTDWYKAQPQETRARIGLHLIATKMKAGLQFENILKRGLLEYAFTLPDNSVEYRYAYHEVIEEAQHGLMFQEFVNRTGLEVQGLSWDLKLGSRRVVKMGRRFPAMFFIFVLGGEDPIDYVQRETLRSGRDLHPLLERIMRIHVTEEARHLSFARHYLKRSVPKLSWLQRQALSIQAPITLGVMASVMLRPSKQVVRTYGIPAEVIKEAYGDNPKTRQALKDSLHKVRKLCIDLGIVSPASKLLWKRLGIWDAARV
ncbi:MAG TPA: diiron oxygenase [Acidimicrobiales bacterium]|nr:diiron oxygenase [Acidimicrobiales bacterium]